MPSDPSLDADLAPLREGETVVLLGRGIAPLLVPLARRVQSLRGVGVVDLGEYIGRPPGTSVTWIGREYRIARPRLSDFLREMDRGAQIVTPKDAGRMLGLAGVGPGSVVAEAGSGSGALTLELAHAVGPRGRVVSYDRRPAALDVAGRNLARAGWLDRVRFCERDVVQDGFDETEFASVLLDLPEPWSILGAVRSALRPGGSVATYTPTYNQLERTVRGLRETGFEEVESLELLERPIHVGEGGTRPAFEMLGHTGFLASGRRAD